KKLPAVIGTTGLDDRAESALGELARVAPVVVAPNMSPGMTVLFELARRAAELLGEDFDAEVLDLHHRAKVDAPSGSAKRLGEVIARAKGLDEKKAFLHGRSGQIGARTKGATGVVALRAA